MSYDIYLKPTTVERCPTCGTPPGQPDKLDPTRNLGPIFTLALAGMGIVRSLNGRKASETIIILRGAIARMQDPGLRAQFAVLEADNAGWGTLVDGISVMSKMLFNAGEYPNHVWEIR